MPAGGNLMPRFAMGEAALPGFCEPFLLDRKRSGVDGWRGSKSFDMDKLVEGQIPHLGNCVRV
jgi:hypothetical protein